MQIPLVDLKAQFKSIQKEMESAIKDVFRAGQFIGGEEVSKFAVEFAGIANTPYCIPCANGTDAIEIALTVLGVGKGDEVIIPAFSFVATLEAVCNVGARPVLCDIDPLRYSITAELIKPLITKRTKAIIPVHLYGQMADMGPIMKLSEAHDLYVIEDAAQAHKAEYKGLMAGSIGHFGTFSFYPGKNLGAYGDAGAMTCQKESWHDSAKKIANHGRINKYDHEIVGRNSRMDTLQAAILNVKAKHLEIWIKARREAAQRYDGLLKSISQVTVPVKFMDSPSVYHLYVIRVPADKRDALRTFLTSERIETGVHYPIALSRLKVTTKELQIKSKCPEAEKASNEVISLPLYPELTTSMQEYISSRIKKFFILDEDKKNNALDDSLRTHKSKKKG